MAWTTPRTFVPGELVTASMLNIHVRDNLNFLFNQHTEGTFIPAIGGTGGQSGQVYSNREGRYIRIGQFVWAAGYVRLTTLGTITGNVQITGLPFVAEVFTLQFYPGVCIWEGLTTSIVNLQCYVPQNNSLISLFYNTAANASGDALGLNQGDLSATSNFKFAVFYRTSAP